MVAPEGNRTHARLGLVHAATASPWSQISADSGPSKPLTCKRMAEKGARDKVQLPVTPLKTAPKSGEMLEHCSACMGMQAPAGLFILLLCITFLCTKGQRSHLLDSSQNLFHQWLCSLELLPDAARPARIGSIRVRLVSAPSGNHMCTSLPLPLHRAGSAVSVRGHRPTLVLPLPSIPVVSCWRCSCIFLRAVVHLTSRPGRLLR